MSIYLRLAPSATAIEQPLRLSAAPHSRHPSRAARILVVDDEPAVLRGLKRLLRGHEVTVTTNGREGVELYRSGSFDIVFCDVMMPRFSGMEFVQELEKIGPEHATRVVMMTGGVVSESIRAFIEKSGNACLSKPFETARLHELIRKWVAHSTELASAAERTGKA